MNAIAYMYTNWTTYNALKKPTTCDGVGSICWPYPPFPTAIFLQLGLVCGRERSMLTVNLGDTICPREKCSCNNRPVIPQQWLSSYSPWSKAQTNSSARKAHHGNAYIDFQSCIIRIWASIAHNAKHVGDETGTRGCGNTLILGPRYHCIDGR